MKAKKSYGQHFLHDERIAERIAHSLQGEGKYTQLLEIGPGTGNLTKHLLPLPYDLQVCEADPDMVGYIQNNFPALLGKIHAGDFLQFNFEEHYQAQVGVIGNFPYNISSQIVVKVVDNRHLIPEMVGMFQKEMADRVVAPPGSKTYGQLGVLAQAFFDTEYLFTVKPGSFNPPPKVQSAVIRLTRKANQDLGCDEQRFRSMVRAAFNQRRKMLRNSLSAYFPAEYMMDLPGFTRRPEVLSVADFVELANIKL